MADVNGLAPFLNTQTPQPAPNPVASEWSVALQDPAVRSSLIQFGLGMMAPPSQGQSPLGQIGQSIGGVGEMFTRQEEQDLKRDKLDSDQSLRQTSLDQGERRTRATEMNAQTRRQSANARQAGGGLSAKDLVRYQIQAQRDLEKRARDAAKAYKKEVSDTTGLTEVSPDAARFKGKSEDQIASELLADPEWKKRNQLSRDQVLQTTIPPAKERVVGRVYQTPKGPLVWEGSGWTQPTPTPALAAGSDDDEDE